VCAAMFTSEQTQSQRLTQEETQWCEDVRRGLKKAGVPLPASQFELATFAVSCQGKTEKCVRRVREYQEGLVKYGLTSTGSDGAVSAAWSDSYFPGYSLGGGHDREGRPVAALSAGAASGSGELHRPDQYEHVLSAADGLHALANDLDAIRSGYTVVWDCRGASTFDKSFFSPSVMALNKWLDSFPCRPRCFLIVDAPWIMRLFVNAVKAVMPSKMVARMHFVSRGEELERFVERSQLPPSLGGTRTEPYAAWLKGRLAVRERNVRAFSMHAMDPMAVRCQSRESGAGPASPAA